MSNRQDRKARKAAVRAGDNSQQFEHEPKRATRPAPTRDRKEAERKTRSTMRSMLRDPIAALAKIQSKD